MLHLLRQVMDSWPGIVAPVHSVTQTEGRGTFARCLIHAFLICIHSMSWLGMNACPLLGRCDCPHLVCFPFSCDILVQGIVRVGCA